MSRTLSAALLLIFTLFGAHQWLHLATAAPPRGRRMYDRPAGPHLDPRAYDAYDQASKRSRDLGRDIALQSPQAGPTNPSAAANERAPLPEMTDVSDIVSPPADSRIWTETAEPWVAIVQPPLTRRITPPKSLGSFIDPAPEESGREHVPRRSPEPEPAPALDELADTPKPMRVRDQAQPRAVIVQPPLTRSPNRPRPLGAFIDPPMPDESAEKPALVRSPEPAPIFDDKPIGSGVRLNTPAKIAEETSPALRKLREAIRAAEGEPSAVEQLLSAIRERVGLKVVNPAEADLETIAPADRPRDYSPRLKELRARLSRTLAVYYRDSENVATRTPWGVMHLMLPFGVDAEVVVDDHHVNAIGWLCWNGPCRGERLLYTENGYLRTRQGPNLEGHRGQFLAMLAQSKVQRDFELRIDDERFSVQDLVRFEMATCHLTDELTFKLIGLAHYLESDTKWRTEDGQTWSVARLVRAELDAAIADAACGGTHRMMALAYAVNRREKRQEPIEGVWLEAQRRVEDFQRRALAMQNPDGSMSTEWFGQRGSVEDIDRRIRTTGHMLEWLIFSLPESQLEEDKVVTSVEYLLKLLSDHADHEWAVGPKGHALRALTLYDERVFGGKPGERKARFAKILDSLAR